jgi:hypothetical protein
MFSGSLMTEKSVLRLSTTLSPLSCKDPLILVITTMKIPETAPATITAATKKIIWEPVKLNPIFSPHSLY